MLGPFLRLTLFAAALVGAMLLFIYAAVVAVIFIPVVLIALFLLRKSGAIKWTVIDLRTAPRGPNSRPTVIEHDPNDVTITREP